MIIDILIVILLLIGIYNGYRHGFINSTLQIIGLIFIIGISWLAYPYIGPVLNNYFHMGSIFSSLTAFILSFIVLGIVWNLVFASLVSLIPDFFKKNILNKVFGTLPGFIYMFLYVSVLSWFLLNYPIQIIHPYISNSRIMPVIAKVWNKPFLGSATKIDTAIRSLGATNSNQEENEPLKKINIPYSHLSEDTDSEALMLVLINNYRAQNGKKPLVLSPELKHVALNQANDMWSRQFFSHVNPDGLSPFDRLNQANVPYIEAGENLALAQEVNVANASLIASPKHRENILYAGFQKVGIAVVDSGNGNGKMFVQEFSN